MDYKVLNDFVKEKELGDEILASYLDILPDEMINIWKQYGLGSFLNGYLKIIDPDEFKDILEETYSRAKVSAPIFATGLGDIINIEDGKYLRIVKYRRGNFYTIPTSFKFLLSDLNDEEFCNRHLDWKQYLEAISINEIPKYDECFGYVPILGLGGYERVENLQTVKLKEHIMLITELMGPIE